MQGWTYEKKSLLACQNNSKLIKHLSGERISKEVRKIFPYKNCQQAFTMMEQIGISEEIFGQQNLNSQGLGLLQLASEKLEIPICWQHQLACLVNYQINSTDYIVRRWRLSNADKKLINILTQQSSGLCDEINYGLLDQLTIGQYQWLMVKELANKPKTLLNNDATTIKQLLSLTRSKKQTQFPINGTDLKQLGIKGKDIGEMLRKLRKLWIDSEFSLTSPQLINKIEPQG
jgi:tRNA nucleotidyltransferase/poly(A) polymerase